VQVLDLFSGIGGFSLGLERAGSFRTVAFCERDEFCQAVLRKHWPDTPLYEDVRTIPTGGLGRVDIIVGGFPCQPWSQAGQQRGSEDDRDLWPEMARLVAELRPKYLIGENVRGFVSQPMGLQRSLSDLESLGYQAVSFIVPACAVNAPHRRDRVWIVAHSNSKSEADGTINEERLVADAKRGRRGQNREQRGLDKVSRSGAHAKLPIKKSSPDVAHAAQLQRDGGGEHTEQGERQVSKSGKRGGTDGEDGGPQQWLPESRMGGMADGFPRWLDEPDCGRVATGVKNRVPRLKALGNAVVPQVVEQIGRAILAAEEGE